MLSRIYILPLILLFLPFPVKAEIIVYDAVGVKNKHIMLKAETKDRFFKKGGEVLEFFVDGRSIGKILSGGDGLAFKQFKPTKRGSYRITVKSEKEEGDGIFLSLKRNEGIIFVDVEGSLWEEMFIQKPKKGSQKIIEKLSKRFPVVFLQTNSLNVKNTKKWLKEQGFVELPVIQWNKGLIFDEIMEKGLKIKAIIGSASVINSAKDHKIKRLISFDEIEDAEVVKDWDDIEKKLR